MKFQNGNALFLVLIAITLFGALSYAVTQSFTSGSNNDQERTRLKATEIQEYAADMETAVQRLIHVHGCKDTELSLANDSDGDGVWVDADDDYNNANSPADGSCHIYHPNGGGMQAFSLDGLIDTSQSAELYYNTILITGRLCVDEVGSGYNNCQNEPTSAGDLIMFFPYLKENICNALNKDALTSIPAEYNTFYFSGYEFMGLYDTASRISTTPSNDGYYSMCIEGAASSVPADGTYHYYHVILAR